MKTNATVQHYRFNKSDKKAIKKARKNRHIARQVKRGLV